VHLAHWNAHGREWADLLAQQNDQSSYDEWILTEVTNLLRIFNNAFEDFAKFHSSRTARCQRHSRISPRLGKRCWRAREGGI